MPRNIVQEAVEDAEQLKRHTLESAKRMFAEHMAPEVKKTVDAILKEGGLGGEGEPPSGYQPEGEQKRIGKNFPANGEHGEDLEDKGNGPAIVEDEEPMEEDVDVNVDDEDYEDVEDDDQLYEGDMDDDEELEIDVDEDEDGEEDININIEDEDGEDEWDEDEEEMAEGEEFDTEGTTSPKPIPESSTVRRLKTEVRNLRKANGILKGTITEVNVFNARLLALQKLQGRYHLNDRQVNKVVNTLDECESINDVKKIYRALREGLEYNDSRRNIRRKISSRNIQPSISKKMNESVDATDRMKKLAGIIR
jgi:hypothetical protein